MGVIKKTGSFFLLVIIGTGLVLIWDLLRADPEPDLPETPVIAFAERPSQAPLRVLIIASKNEQRQALICEKGTCQTTRYPATASGAVSDGEWWYYYQVNEDDNKTILKRVHSERDITEDIMESTPLTEPRDLYISPDGKRVAFFLDNVGDPAEQLTEIWVYDVDTGGIRLLAEKLFIPDIKTDPRWNESSTHLFFIADTGEQNTKEDELELIIVNVQPPQVSANFADVKWEELVEDFPQAIIDLATSGDQLAYRDSGLLGQTVLRVKTANDEQRTSVRGTIPYLQWLEDGTLLYAIQDRRGFTFWRRTNETNRFVARRPGNLKSARSDVSGQYVAFIAESASTINQLHSLHIESGVILDEGIFPEDISDLFIVHVNELPATPATQVAGVSSELVPEEIAAFIDNNLEAITGLATAQPLRFITTDQTNTVFLDYAKTDEEEERLLLTIHDAIHVEWSIKGRYRAVNNEWQKVQASGLEDPIPQALYEWEQGIEQWIFKEEYSR